MADAAGNNGVIFISSKHLSGYFNDLSIQREKVLADNTKFGATSHTKLALPLYSGKVVATGIYDGDATLVSADLNTAFTAADTGNVMTVAPVGTTVGNEAFILVGVSPRMTVGQVITGIASMSFEAESTGGTQGICRALWHKALAAIAGAGSGTSINNGASTANGGEASLHVTAYTSGDATPKIQHSANDSTWADLITFTLVGGLTSERKTVSGTVNQYTREDHTTVTAPALTYAAAFGRY